MSQSTINRPPASGRRKPTGELDQIFHCLADPSRRKIVDLLREAGEQKIGNLAQAFDMTLNGVSKHLKVMEQAGLVRRRVQGREHWIRVDPETLKTAFEWLHARHHFWSQRLDALSEYVTEKDKKPRAKLNRESKK